MSGTRNLIQLSLTLGKKGSCYKTTSHVHVLSTYLYLPQSSNNHKAELELMLTFFLKRFLQLLNKFRCCNASPTKNNKTDSAKKKKGRITLSSRNRKVTQTELSLWKSTLSLSFPLLINFLVLAML